MQGKLLIKITIFFVILSVCQFSGADESRTGNWEGLRRMMGDDAFHAAGLHKLSQEELEQLDHWLLGFLAHDSEAVVQTDETIRGMQYTPVRHRIPGRFRGWSGKTVFTLENGEVWRQRMPGRYVISLDDPEVEIYRNLLGLYEMKVLQTGRRVGVQRVK